MTQNPGSHILVVDDDPKIRLLLRRCFEGEGYRVSEAGSGSEVDAIVSAEDIDLVTLDLSLPDMDGLTIARAIRTRSSVPIIMVTGKGDMIDRVVGLELGADDYIAKPFHLREVLARVRAVLRRASERAHGTADYCDGIYSFDRWVVDLPKRELRLKSGAPCTLTTAEFGLLAALVRHPNRVLSRDQLMDLLKGQDWSPVDRSIDNLVARLRKKIEVEPQQPVLLKTVRGVGYTLTTNVRAGA